MTVLMSVNPARMKRRRNAVASATIASMIGMNAATNVRNTMSSTISAASMPSSSDDPLFDRRELRLAVVLDRHADGLHGRPHGIFDGDHRVAVLVLDRLVELRLRVGDAPALREVSAR